MYRFQGTGTSSGIGIGKAVVIKERAALGTAQKTEEPKKELERFHRALEQAEQDTLLLADRLERQTGADEAQILRAHLQLLKDPVLIMEIEEKIETEGLTSEYAVEQVCGMYQEMFSAMEDETVSQRAADIRDIKNRLQDQLLGTTPKDLSCLSSGSILAARDLLPSMTVGLKPEQVVGIVTELGGKNAHSAILARAMGIPAVAGVKGLLEGLQDGREIILDGDQGLVLVDPEQADRALYEQKRSLLLKQTRELEQYRGLPTRTADGCLVELAANIGSGDEAEEAVAQSAEAVGLFRTEFLFMDRSGMPSEEEQFQAYRQAAQALAGRPVIIRTLDVGGDKKIPYMDLPREDNPFLGYRAVRYCLGHSEEVYKPQLRAILRASAWGCVRIMVPMVTSLEELRQVRELIRLCMGELDREGIAYDRQIQVGIMVETAAAAVMADAFAREADFFSIGTNDLIQYTMSADRGNEKVSYLYSPLDPAVLRSIRHIISCGKKQKIMVGMCGEAAADPLMVPLLLAFGLDEFSVSPASVLRVRRQIAGISMAEAQKAADQVLQMTTAAEIRAFMKNFTEKVGLNGSLSD